MPLSRLLNLYVSAIQSLHKATDTFLGHLPAKVPYIVGIAGSVAVGKSTMARILQTLLSRWPDHPRVDLITTDGFLYPIAVLEKRGLMDRKGFPESYDQRRLVRFLTEIKSGKREVDAPVYSHLTTMLSRALQVVRQPDILIVEGLNVLQSVAGESGSGVAVFVSDFFDFSIYIDADEATIENWYVARFSEVSDGVSQPRVVFHPLFELDHWGGDEESSIDLEGHQWTEFAGQHFADARASSTDLAQRHGYWWKKSG